MVVMINSSFVICPSRPPAHAHGKAAPAALAAALEGVLELSVSRPIVVALPDGHAVAPARRAQDRLISPCGRVQHGRRPVCAHEDTALSAMATTSARLLAPSLSITPLLARFAAALLTCMWSAMAWPSRPASIP